MALKAHFYKHTLNFRFDAGTSRGVLKNKDSFYIKIWDSDAPEIFGLGEAGPLQGLSVDFGKIAEGKLKEACEIINRTGIMYDGDLTLFPSVKFALDTANSDLKNGGVRKIHNNSFYDAQKAIAINGLVWMGTKDFMKKQIIEKIEAGFDTIKLKIGAIDFTEELSLLSFIRQEFAHENLCVRVDANGAFSFDTALEKLHRLSAYNIHSIEQPIAVGQYNEMAFLCENSPIPIALDEELIPVVNGKREVLSIIKPQYIILKPSLMGDSPQWINIAESLGIGWWITSALESNIGLNAVCQLAGEYNNLLPQGLGTGQLYKNNFDSPLTIENGEIRYQHSKKWCLDFFKD